MSDPQQLAHDAAKVAARLRQAARCAILTHQRPDPDALGSQAALARMLARLGAQVTVINYEPVPEIHVFLQQGLPDAGVTLALAEHPWAPGGAFDTIAIVDTHAYQQLEPVAAGLRENLGHTVVIDHHLSGDVQGAAMLIDPSAASCAELLVPLAAALGVRLDGAIAEALLAGMVADTGWFRFDSVRAQTLRAAAELVDAGATTAALYKRMQQCETPSKLALMQRALASIEYIENARGAVMTLRQSDFTETGGTQTQTDEFVNLTLMVKSVEVGALVTEMPDGRVRCSFRSKHIVDVNKLATEFGGGGHARAAGCRMGGPLSPAHARISAAIRKALN